MKKDEMVKIVAQFVPTKNKTYWNKYDKKQLLCFIEIVRELKLLNYNCMTEEGKLVVLNFLKKEKVGRDDENKFYNNMLGFKNKTQSNNVLKNIKFDEPKIYYPMSNVKIGE